MVTTYFITGANRGLGKGLVAAYLSKPNNVVIAAVRNPADSRSTSLHDLPKAPSSKLIIVKIESTSETDAINAVSELKTTHNIHALDVVIANAAISKIYPRVENAKPADILEHYNVNVIGVVLLFQAVLPLLRKSQHDPAKFVALGSTAGTIGAQELAPVPNAVYGPSKAALNWIVKKIHLENEDLVAFPIHPGWVQTEMGNAAARDFGLEKADITLEQSISGVTNVINSSTRDLTSGKFAMYDGAFCPW